MRLLRRRRDDERGVVLILFCLAITALTTIVALVLELAQLRTDRRVNKSAADLSVRAGLGVLNLGPWSGVCRASDYLRANSGFPPFDPGSEKWFQLGSPLNQLTSSPCLNTSRAPFVSLCLPAVLGVPNTSTWGKLSATAGKGRFTVEIQSGYAMPDIRFPEDGLAAADTGDPLKGSCDNLAVIITEKRTPLFARVFGGGDRTTTIRSVGRVSLLRSEEYSPALLLLDQVNCDALSVNSNNSRVIAQPYRSYPGVIQVDSGGRNGCAQNQAVLNGAATSDGPSILACSAHSTAPGCITVANGSLSPNAGIGDRPSRVGMHALNFPHAPGDYVTSAYLPDPPTYGDTRAVRAAQSGREPLDKMYRQNVVHLDAEAHSVLLGNGGKPPGCSVVVANACTGNGRTWLVLNQSDCDTLSGTSAANFFTPLIPVVPDRKLAQNIWFGCNLTVGNDLLPLVLAGPDSYIAVTGSLTVTSTFALTNVRTFFVGGKDSGNKIGLDIGNGGNLNVNNLVPGADCLVPTGIVGTTRMVVGKGSFNMASGGTAHLCQTFVFMASGYGTVPGTDGRPPCSNPWPAGTSAPNCAAYLGRVSIGSGATVDWSAPNLFRGVRPSLAEVLLSSIPAPLSPYEDLGLWTEAGGPSTVSGGGSTRMSGVFFLPNADAFTLAGNAGANVFLSAQFISQRMKVTGGAVVNLVLDPFDAVPVVIADMVLVR